MIRTTADLLEEFRKKEVQLLDEKHIPHPPTIGDMYEGLTKNILGKTFPDGLGLKVTSGFIRNEYGEWSKQIDCMLVVGDGESIPYTEDFVYELQNVIAVVEVKKKLYSKDLLSAYNNMYSLRKLLKANQFPENDLFFDAYRTITKSEPYDKKLSDMPFWKRQLGLTLFSDSVLPVRIVFGYHGFETEFNFRMAFAKLIEDEIDPGISGAPGLPNLIISDGYSLVKLNGMPYSYPMIKNQDEHTDDFWHLLASYSNNPMIILLELIYTKIAYEYKIGDPNIESDLEIEILKPFLMAKAIEKEGKQGWIYNIVSIPEEKLEKAPSSITWQPVELNQGHFVILSTLINREFDDDTAGIGIPQDEPDLIAWFDKSEFDLTESIEYLYTVGLVSKEIGKLRLLTKECKMVALPDGRIIAGDDSSGRLTNWITKFMTEYRKGREG